jgi:hypothetical protein
MLYSLFTKRSRADSESNLIYRLLNLYDTLRFSEFSHFF